MKSQEQKPRKPEESADIVATRAALRAQGVISPENESEKTGKKENLDPKRMDSIMKRTGEQLHEIFRKGYHDADVEASIKFNLTGTKYPSGDKAAYEAYNAVWDANERLAENATKEELEEALTLLDSAVAIQNEPKYREIQQTVVRRLEKMKEQTH